MLHSKIRRPYGTNQNLIARQSNSYIDPTGCENISVSKFLEELVAAINWSESTKHETFASIGILDPYFWRHLESGFPEMGARSPGLQRGQTKSSGNISQGHLRGAGCLQNIKITNLGSRRKAVNLRRYGDVLENVVFCHTHRDRGPTQPSDTPGK